MVTKGHIQSSHNEKRQRLIKAVIYLRRSTKKQETSIAEQRQAVYAYAEEHGYEIVGEYIDDGISGDETEKRTDFLRMREEANWGRFEVVLCWDQDRFGRFDSLEAGHWCFPFRQAGVQLVTVNNGPIDWNDFTGRMMYSMAQEAKHQFLQDLSRNVTRGLSEAAKSGSWIGSPPYAYRLVGERKNKRLEPGDPGEVEVVKRIFREFVVDRQTMTDIAKGLTADGIPSSGGKSEWKASAVKVILDNPAYIGTFRCFTRCDGKYHTYQGGEIAKGRRQGANDESDWIVFEDHHELIVTKQTYRKAQRLLARNKGRKCRYKPNENPYMLSGVLYCGCCGSELWGIKNRSESNKTRARRYECSRRRRQGKNACDGTTIGEMEILDYLTEWIENEFLSDCDHDRLFRAARDGKLEEPDLPKAFKKLKRLLFGSSRSRTKSTLDKGKLREIDGKIVKARRNLSHINDPENIPAVEEQIRKLKEQRDEIRERLTHQPTEEDINTEVIQVLRQLVLLDRQREEDFRPVLRDIDRITVYSKGHGSGSARRYKFERGEIQFQGSTYLGHQREP